MKSLAKQMKRRKHQKIAKSETEEYDGSNTIIHTGSTLLDLAISGGRFHGGGIPSGILVEVFGPSSAGKTVLLSEIAGRMQKNGGQIKFNDPEARLNKAFAKLFGLDVNNVEYTTPDTITEVFEQIRKWNPKSTAPNGIFADSLAALSSNVEMENAAGDKMGMRRAKEFSEQLRKTCRVLTKKDLLLVCSNQIRQNINAGPYGQKYTTTGGEAVGFYASLRLRVSKPKKIEKKIRFAGKEVVRAIGVTSIFEVYKSTVWKPYHIAPVSILFDYGVDDIRQNLQFIKTYTKETQYTCNGIKLSKSMDEAIAAIEEQRLERKLQREVIKLWERIELKFQQNRKPKRH